MALSMPTRGAHLASHSRATAVPRSQAERLWLIAGALVAAVLLLIGYVSFISPQRSQTSEVQSRAATARTQNSALQSRLDALRAQNKNLASYEADLVAARTALPSTSGISDFVRSLQAVGNATGTVVTAVTVGSPVAVVAATPAGAAVATPTPTPTPTAAGAAPAAASVYSLAITGQVTGTYAALDRFLQQLQSVQPRAVLVTGITEGTGAAAGTAAGAPATGATTLSLTMEAFVAPNLTATPQASTTASPTAGS